MIRVTLYNTWCPNYSTTYPIPVEPLFPPLPTYLFNNHLPPFSSYRLLWLSMSDFTGDYYQGVLIKNTGDISKMTRSRSIALHNKYPTTLILWHNLCIYPNNKPNSNIVIFIKTFYVNFICNPKYNSFSDPKGCRHIGSKQKSWFIFFPWLFWASAKLILKVAQNQISPESKPGKIYGMK